MGLVNWTTPARWESSGSFAAPRVWRRLFHLVAGSIVPVAGIFAPWPAMVIGSGILAATSLLLDLVRFRSPLLNRLFLRWMSPLLKPSEDYRFTGSTYMLVASFIAFLAFDQKVAVTALLFLSIGDPLAALVGGRAPGPRWARKSPGGTIAFIGASLLIVVALVSTGAIQYHWSLLVGALVAGLVELTPIPLDDNLTVPLISGAVMHLLMV